MGRRRRRWPCPLRERFRAWTGIRYRDAPQAALKTVPAKFYIALKTAASLAALGPIHRDNWLGERSTHVLMAGVSALAFFRSALSAPGARSAEVAEIVQSMAQGLARDLKTLDERQIDPVIRSQLPGLALLTVVGSDVFR